MNFNEAFSDQERQIVSGYLALVAEKPHGKVTVKELTETCGIARTTFYRFFEDTYDLLERIEQYLLGELVLYRPHMARGGGGKEGGEDGGIPVGEPYHCIEHWFAVGIRLRALLRPIMSENGDLYFKERLIQRLKTELSQMMDDERVPNDELRPYYVATIAAAYIGLLNHIALVDDGGLLPVSAIAEIANSMRVAYFTSGNNPPAITDERLFG